MDYDIWEKTEEAMESARLVAWDGCHKIYVAMDDEQAEWFRENYEDIFLGSPSDMFVQVQEWFSDSCALRFIQGVTTNEQNPNLGFVDLISQDEAWHYFHGNIEDEEVMA